MSYLDTLDEQLNGKKSPTKPSYLDTLEKHLGKPSYLDTLEKHLGKPTTKAQSTKPKSAPIDLGSPFGVAYQTPQNASKVVNQIKKLPHRLGQILESMGGDMLTHVGGLAEMTDPAWQSEPTKAELQQARRNLKGKKSFVFGDASLDPTAVYNHAWDIHQKNYEAKLKAAADRWVKAHPKASPKVKQIMTKFLHPGEEERNGAAFDLVTTLLAGPVLKAGGELLEGIPVLGKAITAIKAGGKALEGAGIAGKVVKHGLTTAAYTGALTAPDIKKEGVAQWAGNALTAGAIFGPLTAAVDAAIKGEPEATETEPAAKFEPTKARRNVTSTRKTAIPAQTPVESKSEAVSPETGNQPSKLLEAVQQATGAQEPATKVEPEQTPTPEQVKARKLMVEAKKKTVGKPKIAMTVQEQAPDGTPPAEAEPYEPKAKTAEEQHANISNRMKDIEDTFLDDEKRGSLSDEQAAQLSHEYDELSDRKSQLEEHLYKNQPIDPLFVEREQFGNADVPRDLNGPKKLKDWINKFWGEGDTDHTERVLGKSGQPVGPKLKTWRLDRIMDTLRDHGWALGQMPENPDEVMPGLRNILQGEHDVKYNASQKFVDETGNVRHFGEASKDSLNAKEVDALKRLMADRYGEVNKPFDYNQTTEPLEFEPLRDAVNRRMEEGGVPRKSPPTEEPAGERPEAPGNAPDVEKPGRVTSIQNGVADIERTNRGQEPLETELRRTWPQALDAAKKKMTADPRYAEKLIASLTNHPRPHTDVEAAALAMYHNACLDATEAAADAIIEAHDSDDAKAMKEAQRAFDEANERLEASYRINKNAGSEAGRALNIRKMFLNRANSLVRGLKLAKAAKGGDNLTVEEIAEITELHARAAELETKTDNYQKIHEGEKVLREDLERRQAEREELDAKGGIRRAKGGGKSKPVYGEHVSDELRQQYEAAKAQIAERKAKLPTIAEALSGNRGSAPISLDYEEVLGNVRTLMRYHIEAASTYAWDTIYRLVHQDLGDELEAAEPGITDKVITDAFMHEVNERRAANAEKAQSKRISNTEEALKVKKSTPPSPKILHTDAYKQARAYLQKLRQDLRVVEGKDDPKVAAVKARLIKQAAELQHAIDEHLKLPSLPRTEAEETEATRSLRTKVKALRKTYDEMHGVTDETKRADAGMKRMNNRLLQLEGAIGGSEPMPEPKGPVQYGPEGKALRARVDEANAVHREMKRGAEDMRRTLAHEPGDTPEVTAKKTRMLKQIDKLFDAIQKGEVTGRRAAKEPSSGITADMEETLHGLQQTMGEMRKAADDLSGLTERKRVAQGMKRMQAQIDRYKQLAETGERLPLKKGPVTRDAEWMKLRDELAKARAEYKERITPKRPDDVFDIAAKIQREAVLSNPIVVIKLLLADLTNRVADGAADLMGLTTIAGKAKTGGVRLGEIEGGREGAPYTTLMKANGRQFVAAFSKLVWRDMAEYKKTGTTEIDRAAGLTPQANELGGIIGKYLHGPAKVIIGRMEFEKSLYLRLMRAQSKGFDVSDPEVQESAILGAALDAQMEKMQGPNVGADTIKAIQGLARRTPVVGKPLGYLAKLIAPIVKVPMNILGRETEMTGAGLLEGEGLRRAAGKRFANEGVLPTGAEADKIVRAYKYGGLGLVAMLLGLTQPVCFKTAGGYPGRGHHTNVGSDGKTHLAPGSAEIVGHKIPKYYMDSPFLEAVNFWATVGRDYHPAGAGALGNAGMGLAEQVPGEMTLSMLYDKAKSRQYGVGIAQLLSTYEPQALKKWAQVQDRPQGTSLLEAVRDSTKVVHRKPKTFAGEMELGIPYLRQKAR